MIYSFYLITLKFIKILNRFVILFIITLLPGFVSAQNSIEYPNVKWKFESGAPIRGSFISDQGRLYFGNSAGVVFCIDKETSKEQWSFKTAGAIVSAPCLIDDRLIIVSRDHFVYALNKVTGSLIWKFKMQPEAPHTWGWDYYMASPVTYKNMVFIGSGDHHLYSLNKNTGKMIWKFETKDKIRATPILQNDKLFVPSFDGIVYVLNVQNGKATGLFVTEGVDHYGKVFGWDRTAIFNKGAIKDSLLVFGSRDGSLYCVNTANLKQKWKFAYGSSWVGSAPLISDQTVFVGWSDQLVFSAHDLLTGKEKWKYNCQSYVYSTPVCDDRNVYTGTFDGKIYGFEKSSGKVAWEYPTGAPILSSPLLEENILYIGNEKGELLAIKSGDEVLKTVYLPRNLKDNPLFADKKIAPYLQENGFNRLDTISLQKFMLNRIADGKKSVVVFAHQYIPREIAGKDPESGLLKKYMERGGKIIWMGQFPNFWEVDKEMNVVGYDITYASALLGIRFDVNMDFGSYYASATKEGKEWGLPDKFSTQGSSISSESKVIPLSLNEFGRIADFWKPFSNDNYSGFVSYMSWTYMPITNAELEVIKKLAEKGLEKSGNTEAGNAK
jgi:eukaryotic-like serine/threonine-protein kinase